MSLVFGVAMLAGCATPPPADDPDAVADFNELNDPMEPMNRFIFDNNMRADRYILRPAAEGYRAVVPQFGRNRVSDFIANLKSPVVFMNQVLQGNLSRAGVTIERFLLNSTFGVGGIMDVSTPMGIKGHDADFGETLAVWGVGEGPYLVLPLLGPSNPRDGIGYGVDSTADPLGYYLDDHHMRWVAWTRFGVSGIATREAYLDVLDDVKRTSLDYYSAMRSLYRQHRQAEIIDARNPASNAAAGADR
jgi:phospholipid-binding lipoprotein MlaA